VQSEVRVNQDFKALVIGHLSMVIWDLSIDERGVIIFAAAMRLKMTNEN
jgi:hypothetical protein